MSTITSLTDLSASAEHITEDQLKALIASLHVKINNILHGAGDLGAINTSTPGPAGITINFAASLQSFIKLLEHYEHLLANPQLRGDFSIEFSQSSPVEFNPHVSDFPNRYS